MNLNNSSIMSRANILNEFGYGLYKLLDGYYVIASPDKSRVFYAEGRLFDILEEAELFLGID